jgi:hypothetical protein
MMLAVFKIIAVRGKPSISILDLSELAANFEPITLLGKEIQHMIEVYTWQNAELKFTTKEYEIGFM